MEITQLIQRYENHPLGTTLKSIEAASDFKNLHRFYIAAKTMILLLEFQKELTKPEADALEKHVQDRVDLVLAHDGQATVSH